jgi:tartrate dehydrogenase/decarboxylase / D-malate dehydrogenase
VAGTIAESRHPSLLWPVHDSTPSIVGKGIAYPIGDFWSLQLMLDFLGESAAANLLMRAIEDVLAAGEMLTPDLGGRATTAQLSAAVRDAVRRLAATC